MGGKSPYTFCKIEGCTGEANQHGIFVRGFCRNHYNDYRKGKIDIRGRPRQYLTRLITEDRRQYNMAVNQALTAANKASSANNRYEEEIRQGSPITVVPENEVFHDGLKKASHLGTIITSREFVFGSIEHFNNSTLRRILSDHTGYSRNMSALDEAKITKMLMNGNTIDTILVKWGHKYTRFQIEQVLTELKKLNQQ